MASEISCLPLDRCTYTCDDIPMTTTETPTRTAAAKETNARTAQRSTSYTDRNALLENARQSRLTYLRGF